MTVTYGFYNSVNGDRKYDAKDFAEIFDGIIEDGVHKGLGEGFKVTATGGENIAVGTGRAWFNHTWTLNDTAVPFTIDAAHPSLNRIDAIVLEVDSSDSARQNQIRYIRGTPAATALRPTMIRSETLNQYALAYISKPLNTSGVSAANITNVVGTPETPWAVSRLLDRAIEPAGMRRNVFRGKYLGTSYTTAQKAAVASGTFEDLYLGDYWTINGVNWRIVDFDYYYLQGGPTRITWHHLVVMPDTHLRAGAMNANASKGNAGAYAGSDARSVHRPPMATTIKAAFPGDSVFDFSTGITSDMVVSGSGTISGGGYSQVSTPLELPSGTQLFGNNASLPGATGNVTILHLEDAGGQFALFRLCPWFVPIPNPSGNPADHGVLYWTRDVLNQATWSCVNSYGQLSAAVSTAAYGMRPYFCLK